MELIDTNQGLKLIKSYQGIVLIRSSHDTQLWQLVTYAITTNGMTLNPNEIMFKVSLWSKNWKYNINS